MVTGGAVNVTAGPLAYHRPSMDLSPTPSEVEFRAELREWLRDNLPWEYGTGLPPRFEDLAEEVAFLRRGQSPPAAGRGVRVSSPPAVGGPGTGPAPHHTVREGGARAPAP